MISSRFFNLGGILKMSRSYNKFPRLRGRRSGQGKQAKRFMNKRIRKIPYDHFPKKGGAKIKDFGLNMYDRHTYNPRLFFKKFFDYKRAEYLKSLLDNKNGTRYDYDLKKNIDGPPNEDLFRQIWKKEFLIK